MTSDIVGTLKRAIIGKPPLLPPTKSAAAKAVIQNNTGSVVTGISLRLLRTGSRRRLLPERRDRLEGSGPVLGSLVRSDVAPVDHCLLVGRAGRDPLIPVGQADHMAPE